MNVRVQALRAFRGYSIDDIFVTNARRAAGLRHLGYVIWLGHVDPRNAIQCMMRRPAPRRAVKPTPETRMVDCTR